MQKGDISNEVVPRLLIVFEGLLGVLDTPKDRAAELLARKAHRWKSVLAAYTINEMLARHVWDIVWRKNFSVDVVTFLGDDFADLLQERLDKENLPIGRIRSTTSDKLSRELAYDPSVIAVYDPDPSHRFTYGGKTRIMDPNAPSFYGV